MHTYVEFQSEAFPPDPDERDEVNPSRFGRRLAAFVAASLSTAGISVETPRPEDWGWVVALRDQPVPIWIGCGNYDEYEHGFLCFIEPHEPYVRQFFRKIHVEPQVARIQQILDVALRAHPAVRSVRWSTHAEFTGGA